MAVTTPGQFHKDPVLAAIKAGKSVFCEKPLANTAADCKAVVDAEMASGKAHEGLRDPQVMIMKTKGGIVVMLEVNVNCGFGYDINCEVVCENGVVNLPCPSFPTVRYANQVSTKIEDNWIMRFIDSYDVEIQDWVDHALKGETGGSSAWDGYVASITADALVKSQTSGQAEKVVTGGTPDFYRK